MPDRILIVEDERDIVRTLEYNLRKEGYQTVAVHTGADALAQAVKRPRPDLILLDLMLPDLSGVEVCRKLRQAGQTRDVPILMLTAKGEEIDRVVGFEVGADDYLVKPFSMRELVLRIKSLLRRAKQEPGKGEAGTPERIELGPIRVDVPAHQAWVEDREIKLTALEFRLLVTLLARRGRFQTRDTLLSDVWGIDADVTTRTVDTHVKRLREKLGAAGSWIETLRGVGYRMVDPQDGEPR